jgi:hypothetical protein
MIKRILSVSLLALTGCEDPLKAVDVIEDSRVLAARVEVDGAPERQSPGPGESAHVRWLVAAPNGDPATGFGLLACSSIPQDRGAVRCSGEPFASVGAPPSVEPSFAFTVPAALDLTRNPHMAVLGSLCVAGTGNVDESGARCIDGEALAVRLDFDLASGERFNLNPNLDASALELDDQPWPAAPAPEGDCQGSGLLELSAAGGERRLRVTLPDTARDELPRTNSAAPARETLTISHFASSGDLSSAFSVIGSADALKPVEFTWAPPAALPSGGRLVRFWFVVRDDRGGSDFTERALCIVP